MNRESDIKSLQNQSFDILVIGGGATGTGIALDAASRGLKVALIERDDYSSGTSSRSTKLVHGGVRYLEQAVLKFDRSQFNLVRDALHERSTLLKIAPHLVKPLGILTPLYQWFEVPYFMTGLRLYDKLSGNASINPSRFLDAKRTLEHMPHLRAKGLKGAVLYYDGQFDDARMNVCLAVTANEQGAVTANYVELESFATDAKKITSARVKDKLSGETWEISAKVYINATGPFADSVRRLEDDQCSPMLSASSGVHLVLDKKFSSPDVGLLIPKTDDGRVLFHLPWEGHTLLGTTDQAASVEADPKVTTNDVHYLIEQLGKFLNYQITPSDILSSWCGLRPLVSNPKASDTAKLSRDHVIQVGRRGLITIAGGKWTTYRKMAADTVDHALEMAQLKAKECVTDALPIAGGTNFSLNNAKQLQRKYKLEADVAAHLNHAYGDRAEKVAEIAKRGAAKRLVAHHPFIEAEVIYGATFESARNAVDLLGRRMRLNFLDFKAAEKALPRVLALLAETLHWNEATQVLMQRNAQQFYDSHRLTF